MPVRTLEPVPVIAAAVLVRGSMLGSDPAGIAGIALSQRLGCTKLPWQDLWCLSLFPLRATTVALLLPGHSLATVMSPGATLVSWLD